MFKIPDWDDDTPESNANFAKRNKIKTVKTATQSSANHATENISRKTKHDKVVSTKKTEKNLNLDNYSKNNLRKRKHDNIANTKQETARLSDLASNDVVKNSPKIQINDNIAKKKAKSEEFHNLDILNAADEALMIEKKKKLDDDIRNEDQEDLLFNEVNGTTFNKKKTIKCKKKNKTVDDASPAKENDSSFTFQNTKHKINKKNQKQIVNHSDFKDGGKSLQKNVGKANKLAVNQIKSVKDRNLSLDTKEPATKNVLNNQTVNVIKKGKNNITSNTDTSLQNETDLALYEKKAPNNFKKEKLRAMLQANRRSIHINGNALRERMVEKLKAAQFRFLNEKLYTSSGSEAQQLFQADPSAFHTYHQGYQQQLKKWPVNPLDIIVQKILKMPKSHIIADMGCGEAALSRRVPHAVHSFDLVGTAAGVHACDMARTPLAAGAVHACVYCLALMGTQLTQYLVEANRVLKLGGQLLIAEVESRFTDAEAFARDVERLGFRLKNLDKSHRVFFFLQFQKTGNPPVKKAKLPELTLNPCLYKKR